MDALRKAGRQRTYRDTTLYTSLLPLHDVLRHHRPVRHTPCRHRREYDFGGNEGFLRERGVEVIVADDPDCIALMTRFIGERPELWAEDIAEN